VAQLNAPDASLSAPMPGTAAAIEAIHLENAGNDQFRKGLTTELPHFIGDRYQSDRRWAMGEMIGSSQPFRERLVMFWANHFTISARAGGGVLALSEAYIQDAIRPHVTGRFEDMLQAVMHHPGMIIYLDNYSSVGPNSEVGRATGKGLNENLARECLELHTLGAKSGYTQQDVTSFAKILTGWTVQDDKEPKGFVFRPETHEPGPKMLMGQSFPEGRGGGEAALSWLAHHPATYKRVAEQLVRQFVADKPEPADVARIAAVLSDTKGDLKAATLAVIDLPGAWDPLTKLRTPVDYIIAVHRALDFVPSTPDDQAKAYWATEYLGQAYQAALLPNGWSDASADWVDGEELLRRADWAFAMAGIPNAPEPAALIAACGPLFSKETVERAQAAGSRRESLALLLSAPEFMRR
jgi:uncharacterized protein (DUF1800 family)